MPTTAAAEPSPAPVQYDELRKLAEAATPGPWFADRPPSDAEGWPSGVAVAATYGRQKIWATPPGGSFPAADQTFIAAWNPAAALAICDDHDRLLADLARARAERDEYRRRWNHHRGKADQAKLTRNRAIAGLDHWKSRAVAAESALAAVKAARDGLRAASNKLDRTLSFFKSVIQSGEAWSATCQRDLDAARAALAATAGEGTGRTEQDAALTELTQEAQDMGLYDAPAAPDAEGWREGTPTEFPVDIMVADAYRPERESPGPVYNLSEAGWKQALYWIPAGGREITHWRPHRPASAETAGSPTRAENAQVPAGSPGQEARQSVYTVQTAPGEHGENNQEGNPYAPRFSLRTCLHCGTPPSHEDRDAVTVVWCPNDECPVSPVVAKHGFNNAAVAWNARAPDPALASLSKAAESALSNIGAIRAHAGSAVRGYSGASPHETLGTIEFICNEAEEELRAALRNPSRDREHQP